MPQKQYRTWSAVCSLVSLSSGEGLVCVREKYQRQGYMRKVVDIAFAEGDRLGVPVILETDAKSKCDKYVHLGMELAGVRDIGEFGKLYDLIKHPKPSNENGTV